MKRRTRRRNRCQRDALQLAFVTILEIFDLYLRFHFDFHLIRHKLGPCRSSNVETTLSTYTVPCSIYLPVCFEENQVRAIFVLLASRCCARARSRSRSCSRSRSRCFFLVCVSCFSLSKIFIIRTLTEKPMILPMKISQQREERKN